MSKLCFAAEDLRSDLPAPGWYPARIEGGRLRRSAAGNRMLELVYRVPELEGRCGRLCEYFVLEGGSAFGLTRTWRRLIGLYRAAGCAPAAGAEVGPRDLAGREVEVELGHDEWRGEPRLKVVGHRPVVPSEAGEGEGWESHDG
jgi:hypothetical protein